MDPEVRKVMATKSILLFSEMLEAIDFPSRQELVHCMASGFPKTGAYPKTHVFLPKARERLLSTKVLLVFCLKVSVMGSLALTGLR